MTLQFLADATHGVGKKMCACNLGCQAILSSQTALFVIAGQLLGDLAAPDSDSALRSKLHRARRTAYRRGRLPVLLEPSRRLAFRVREPPLSAQEYRGDNEKWHSQTGARSSPTRRASFRSWTASCTASRSCVSRASPIAPRKLRSGSPRAPGSARASLAGASRELARRRTTATTHALDAAVGPGRLRVSACAARAVVVDVWIGRAAGLAGTACAAPA